MFVVVRSTSGISTKTASVRLAERQNMTYEEKLLLVEHVLSANRRDYGNPAKEIEALFKEIEDWQDKHLALDIKYMELEREVKELRQRCHDLTLTVDNIARRV